MGLKSFGRSEKSIKAIIGWNNFGKKVPKMPKVTHICHPEAMPKDLAIDSQILRFTQNDSFKDTLAHFSH